METSTPSTTDKIEEGTERMDFHLEVGTNLLNENLKNVEITCELPEGVTYKSFTVYPENVTFVPDDAENPRNLKWTIAEMTENIEIGLQVSINKFSKKDIEEKNYIKNIPIVFKAKSEQTGSKTFEGKFDMISYRRGYELAQTTKTEGDLKEGQEVKYVLTVKNMAPVRVKNVKLIDELSENLTFVKYEYEQNGELKTVNVNRGSHDVKMDLTLEGNETLTVTLYAKANNIEERTAEVINRAKIQMSNEEFIYATPETIKHIITQNGNSEEDPKDPEDPKNEKYIISGTAWIDENRDGKRDDKEELLPNIKVYLLDSETKKIIKEATTSKTGAYTFEDLKFGNYVVAFEYDNKNYDLTTYQADNIDSSLNSDVINMDLKLKEEIKRYAVTNTIALNKDMYNIDLGLVESPKFDLSLTKGVSLIQVSNANGTKNYTFNNTDLAQVQIPEKVLKGSAVAITYTIKVTNEGALSGYVNKVADYKAKDLEFSSSLNPEWYQDTDGNLYNTTLTGREIKPGETVELSLILTKTMTNDNLGISNNTAEIFEASNDLGIEDIDSVPGNKNVNEDDFGKADVIITLNTGGILFYGGILLVVLGIFALGTYEINKRVLRKI